MKKIYILIITLISLQAFSQKDYSRYYNSWKLGLNLGAAWQTADYRSCYGMAGGLTLEKGFHENSTNIFSFAVRGRYLGANTYGMDYNRNYDIKTNDVYNGKYNPKVNYVDSVSSGRNYVYDNYKMTLGEGSLELQLTFNRLRERSHVLLNLWGGVGITSFKTKSDLLDSKGKMYDFSLVDSTGNQTKALSSYNSLIDNKYESDAYGSKAGNLIAFSPSAGIGLGYQFAPGFSMLFEYKVTFPQGTNADLLDGRLGTNKDMIAGSNDYYHYAGLNLLFTLRGKKKNPSTANNNQTVYTNTVVGTNTTVPTNSIATTNTVVTTNTVAVNPSNEPKPVITYITPPTNNYIVTNHQYKISAQILNVTSANQIQFKLNGANYSSFTFNAQNHILEFNANLNTGVNPIQITATNAVGSDNKSTSVIYELPKPAGNPPVITIVNPASCPISSTTKSYNFKAVVAYVNFKNNVTVKVNNISVTNFNFNTTTGQLDLPLNLSEGANTIEVSAFNSFGSDVKNCTINYAAPKQVGSPPVVTYINPVQPGYISNAPSYVVVAQVLNISGQNGISVYYNGMSTPFTYNTTTKQVTFTANLNVGSNSISITANNSNGEDTKETSVVLRENKVTGPPPVVNLLNPALQMNATDNLLYNFKLAVLNVAAKADIELLFNGVSQSNFTYDINTKEVFFQTNLVVGNNTVVVKGTNPYGVDSKTINVNYTPRVQAKLPPVVTMINPLVSPATALNPNYTYKATVTNVLNTSGLVVKYNGAVITNYTYDGFNVNYPATLVQGNNLFEVTATNNDGSDSKTAIVNFRQKAAGVPPIVSLVNPAMQMNATDNLLYNFKLSVLNVNSQADIQLLFNGVAQSNFTYDVNTKEVFFQTNLVAGDNTVSVKGTNAFGVDSKTVHVNYTAHDNIKLPPVITFINPANLSGTSQSTNYIYTATIANMLNSNNIVVKYNGVAITNFLFNGINFTYTATLNNGVNSLEIMATNNDGSDSKTAVVNYRQKIIPRPPVVSILNPVGTPTVNVSTYNFQFRSSNVTQNQVVVTLNGSPVTSYNFIANQGDFVGNLNQGQNILSVTATNADGTATKTENVVYVVVNNTVSVPTSTTVTTPTVSNTSQTLTICHIPRGNAGNPQTIIIPASAWPAHQAHGDVIGTCSVTSTQTTVTTPTTAVTPTVNASPSDTTSGKITICHIPPGNNQNPQTISIPLAAWPAHQAHGDVMGACPSEKMVPIKINPRVNPVKPNNQNKKIGSDSTNTQPVITPRTPR